VKYGECAINQKFIIAFVSYSWHYLNGHYTHRKSF